MSDYVANIFRCDPGSPLDPAERKNAAAAYCALAAALRVMAEQQALVDACIFALTCSPHHVQGSMAIH
jgi:hypothetical protein